MSVAQFHETGGHPSVGSFGPVAASHRPAGKRGGERLGNKTIKYWQVMVDAIAMFNRLVLPIWGA